jgi:GTPase
MNIIIQESNMLPEREDGNIEYKLKLINKDEERIEKLASQMRFRTEEGDGECIYNLGVEDKGMIIGISEIEYEETINVLNSAAQMNNYSITRLSSSSISQNKKIYEVMVREKNDNKYIDLRVAIAGSVDSGKSTFTGALVNGVFDDGRGYARSMIFNYPHEIKSGRTSSISHQILGFDENGDIVNYRSVCGKMSWPDIVRSSSKIVTFFDLAGHEKYLKTTILGLTSCPPNMSFIMIGANRGVLRMTREHIFLCITLCIPFAFVITKMDMIEDNEKVYKDTMTTINKILKSPIVRRIPVKINNMQDILTCAKQMNTESIVPIFNVSNVTGEGLDNIRKFLNVLKKEPVKVVDTNVKFFIDYIWNVTGIGIVVGGNLISGKIKVGDKLFLGPNNNEYESITVKSIHSKRVPVQSVSFGSYICLGLKKIVNRKSIRRGNVILSDVSQQLFIRKFDADIKVLHSHTTTIRVGYSPVLNALSIRQTVRLSDIISKTSSRPTEVEDKILRTGDQSLSTFEFVYQDEYLPLGTKILLSEGRTKVIGVIKKVYC